MKAEEFDRKFDAGEDITSALDLSQAKRYHSEQKTISIDLPVWMLEWIEQEADRLGITPQSIIQTSLAEHLAIHKPT
ncbi:type II toxin-antitoxin system BrnA family antitoxin [Egbenema bharatensis]|uniref:type II toxin-antitoxin system BrnA family antitoxin n=1 Tax=Egbenema bharatensis TaxID=3463334 RepID=UPI003A8789BB